MDEQNITDGSLPVQAGGESAVEAVVPAQSEGANVKQAEAPSGNPEALTLSEMNAYLGKNFPDKATALKALKDTFIFVGKKTEKVEENLKEKGFMTKQEFDDALFYRDNPNHAPHKEVLDSIAKAKGISLSEAAKTDSYKKLFEGAENYTKSQSLKSVLESNPRLASVENRAKTVQDAIKAGNKDAARTEAAKVVMEAFGL